MDKPTLNTEPKEATQNSSNSTLNTDMIPKDIKPLAESVPALAEGPIDLTLIEEKARVMFIEQKISLTNIQQTLDITRGKLLSMCKNWKKERAESNKLGAEADNLIDQRLQNADGLPKIALIRLKKALNAHKVVMDKNGNEHYQDDWTAQLNAIEKVFNLHALYPPKESKVQHTHVKEVKQLQAVFEKRRKQLKLAG